VASQGVDFRGVFQELGDGLQFIRGKIELGHAAAARNARGGAALDERLDGVGIVTEAHINVTQLRGEIGALPQQGVATDAVIGLPQVLAVGNLAPEFRAGIQHFAPVTLWQGHDRIERQGQE